MSLTTAPLTASSPADKTAVTVTFSEFWAEAGPGISASANRKNCQLTFGVNVPAGFTFGVANVDYRGYYQLDSKVTANQQSLYYFQGQVVQGKFSRQTGPFTILIAVLRFSHCPIQPHWPSQRRILHLP